MIEVDGPTFFDVLRSQRACRSFLPEPVPEADIERILTAATWAPSAENLQPWEFVVVTDPDLRRRMGELTRRAWQGGARTYAAGRLSERFFADVEAGATGGIASAPVIVVVAAESSPVTGSALGSSIFPAVQNLLLAANALGYGSALTTLTIAFERQLQELLALPDRLAPMAVLPIGRPARPLGRPRRHPVEERTHRNRYRSRV